MKYLKANLESRESLLNKGETEHISVNGKDPVELDKLMMQERERLIVGNKARGSRIQRPSGRKVWALMGAGTAHDFGGKMASEGKMQVRW